MVYCFGNRYGLFFIPLWLFTITYASSLLCKTRRQKIISVFLILSFIVSGAVSIYSGWIKSDAREAFNVWYQKKAFQEKTLVYFRCIHEFQFYLQHTDNYNASHQDNIITSGEWMRNATYEEMREKLNLMSIFSLEALYYFGEITDSLNVFIDVMSEAGYKIESLHESKQFNGDRHALLYLHMDHQMR